MKIAFTALVVALLAGCVTQPQQQTRRPSSEDDPSARCFTTLSTEAKFAPLSAKIGSIGVPDKAGIEQMASKERVTEEDKPLLSAWAAARQACAEQGRGFRAQYAPPGWVPTYDSLQSGVLVAIANLYGGNITYGEFITERLRVSEIAKAQFSDASNRDMSARQQQAQIDSQRADAAMGMLMQQQQQQQQLQQQRQQALQQQMQNNRTINTTCNTFGGVVSCTSR